ncbi:GNAT family N-acetyltransferase [Sphingomonas sp. KC8]|uniref:GNAT family N-acetyltransferase n=1 Tax=Sphingomonas sp. KC8 TaxID=1030157 RepID=UPI00024892FC|nr:GNAT family N-acetyltransferase [Sphingomonas sp. KC8]ARS26209.1 acetyltransferase [Sphingomonas sp. KC8]
MTSDPTFSENGAHDIAAVMEVMDAAFDPIFGEAWSRSQCLGIFDLPGVWLSTAFVDAVPAGFALTRAVMDEAELLLLGVAPAFRRRGIGRALLDRAMDHARANGVIRFHLEVRQGNDAIALYSRAGFQQAGTRRDYYRGRDGALHDAISLVRTLRDD